MTESFCCCASWSIAGWFRKRSLSHDTLYFRGRLLPPERQSNDWSDMLSAPEFGFARLLLGRLQLSHRYERFVEPFLTPSCSMRTGRVSYLIVFPLVAAVHCQHTLDASCYPNPRCREAQRDKKFGFMILNVSHRVCVSITLNAIPSAIFYWGCDLVRDNDIPRM